MDKVNDFGNPEFKEVAFGEFVYIETLNKRNLDYGKLFRRDADINSPREIDINTEIDITKIKANGATYIGCIAGPDGDVPTIDFVDNATFEELLNMTANNPSLNGSGQVGSWTLRNGLILDNSATSIDYRVLNYRDEAGIARGAVNLTIPIPNVEITANNPSGAKEQDKFIFSKTDGQGPFHHKFQLNIPEHLVKKQLKVISSQEASETDFMNDVADNGVVFVVRG